MEIFGPEKISDGGSEALKILPKESSTVISLKTLGRTLQLPSQGRRRSRKDKTRRKTGTYCPITLMTEVDPSAFTHILEML